MTTSVNAPIETGMENSPADPQKSRGAALTQNQPCKCASPFCDGVAKRSPKGKHGRYCSPHCRMDGFVLRRAKKLMDRVGVVAFVARLDAIEK